MGPDAERVTPDGRPIVFETEIPAAPALRRQVAEALRRPLPRLREGMPHHPHIRIVANGPSARNAPLAGDPDSPVVALNGALALFTRRGLAPDYWVACDPQELVAGFLGDPPRATTYLVASKCHPAVFDALRDRDVVLWHCPDGIEEDLYPTDEPRILGGISVTLRCFNLFRAGFGTRSFETWGWDGNFGPDGADHAVAQGGVAGERISIAIDETVSFDTTVAWAAEAENAVHQLASADYAVTVHGDGLIAGIFRAYATRGR
jgi:hypothetical protein